jgi:predicted transcriptional regulator
MPSMKDEATTKQRVLESIRKINPKDASIQEISEMTKFSRDTVSKYVGILEAEGKIKLARKIGKAKMYILLKIK